MKTINIIVAFLIGVAAFCCVDIWAQHRHNKPEVAIPAVAFNGEWYEMVPAPALSDWLDHNRYSHVEIVSLTACVDRPAYWVVYRLHSMEEDYQNGTPMTP